MNDTLNEKNAVIYGYVQALTAMISNLSAVLSGLGNVDEINASYIKTADIQIIAINSQIVILQGALDSYMGA